MRVEDITDWDEAHQRLEAGEPLEFSAELHRRIQQYRMQSYSKLANEDVASGVTPMEPGTVSYDDAQMDFSSLTSERKWLHFRKYSMGFRWLDQRIAELNLNDDDA